MSSGPYSKSEEKWLEEHETIFRGMLKVASEHSANLERIWKLGGQGAANLFEFVGLSDGDVAASLRVCEQLQTALAPTSEAMRQELDLREAIRRDLGGATH
jgi:hypothetical protein